MPQVEPLDTALNYVHLKLVFQTLHLRSLYMAVLSPLYVTAYCASATKGVLWFLYSKLIFYGEPTWIFFKAIEQ